MGVLVVLVVGGPWRLLEVWRRYLRRVAGLLISKYQDQTPLLIFPSQMVRPLPSLAEALLVFPMVLLVTLSTLNAELLRLQLLPMVKFLMNLMSQVLLLLMRSLLTGPTPSLLGQDVTQVGREERGVTRRVRRRQQRREEKGICLS